MLEFSKIDMDFSIYKKHKVVLWGCGKGGYRVKAILEGNGVKITAFVDSNPERMTREFLGVEVISFRELEDRIKGDDTYLVQISCGFDDEIISRLEQINVEYISYSEFTLRTDGLGKYRIVQKHPELREMFYRQDYERLRELANVEIQRSVVLNELSDEQVINSVVANMKVGNQSLQKSLFDDVISCNHSFRFMGEEFLKYMQENRVNLFCGVRDVIGTNLSALFGMLGDDYFWDAEEYWHGGGDIEEIFNRYVVPGFKDNKCFASSYAGMIGYNYSGEEFFEKHLKENLGIDVYEYPFDVEKGYSIIQKGNIRIMLYQTEKAEKLEKAFAEIAGFGFEFTYKRNNRASDRWYTKAYSKAKDEIRFGKEYFESCFEGKYMRHFYSNEDIEKFKQKWKKNVREVI